MKTFIIYWVYGSYAISQGEDIQDAILRLGYGAGGMRDMAQFQTGTSPSFTWNGREWEENQNA